ncbi:TIGR00730 family Rossman fold protein [Allostreptomyces psammosilenae]|uniref:Uncharacterized protein (TIGR00730 family) n=1 Tax=Allostreptomyces psammosilenae TaxID=1892865 RepID=A0A853A3A1_9ACTN|nr:TIGR00730 family Rossman fold protein [Allostreptomyces psammosilenae]NYI04992.1 uncharacterized protein (TIGR00730 family) [Allostreptomyces psammosilenae]
MRVTVFTGSADGRAPAFRAAATELGRHLAGAGVGVVYGGGHVGLMGAVADAALAAGGEVIGVMPRALVDREVAHRGLSALHVVETMHERKARMAELGDAFVALPGGAGTLEELFEAWTWQQLGYHAKPVALYDVDGFWTPLAGMLDGMVDAGFIRPAYRDTLARVTSPDALLELIAGWTPPPAKWGAPPAVRTANWLHVRDGRLLLVRTRGRDAFYLPGGKLEPDESPVEAVRREVREELGVLLDPDGLREAFTLTAPAHGRPGQQVRMTCFTGPVAAGEPAPGREVEELVWADPASPPACAPASLMVLDRLAAGELPLPAG